MYEWPDEVYKLMHEGVFTPIFRVRQHKMQTYKFSQEEYSIYIFLDVSLFRLSVSKE